MRIKAALAPHGESIEGRRPGPPSSRGIAAGIASARAENRARKLTKKAKR